MPYRIDPVKDWPVVEEFRLNPIGRHSPNLMRVLNTMRYDTSGYQAVLVTRVPFREWVLGTLPPDRSQPVVLHETPVFYNREDAEWAVFCARWEAHTGEAIETPRDVPVPERKTC